MRMKHLFSGLCALFCFNSLQAQYNQPYSPVVHNDGSVTFYLHAPQAKKVEVAGQFQAGSTLLTRNADGMWSATVKPLEADIYPYHFVIDGIKVPDPGNPLYFPNENFKSSLLEIPNSEALYTVNSVPHGKVHYCTYYSSILQQHRTMVIYTPAEYETSPQKKYPVFYLISGTTDTEETWYKAGCPHDSRQPDSPQTGRADDCSHALRLYEQWNSRTLNPRSYRHVPDFLP